MADMTAHHLQACLIPSQETKRLPFFLPDFLKQLYLDLLNLE